MKKLKIILYTIVGLLMFIACDDDDNYENYSDYALTTGTVILEGDQFYITTDDGYNFYQKKTVVNIEDVEDGMRVMFYYTLEGEVEGGDTDDYYITIKRFDAILTKPIFTFNEETTPEVIDSIGETPIHIITSWFTDDYLNIQFEYYGNYKVHYVNLVYDTTNPVTEDGEIILELKHNDNNDLWSAVNWGIASFDISELKKEDQNSIDLFIKSYDYNHEYEYNKVVTYEYGEQDEQQALNVHKYNVPFTNNAIK